MGAKRNPLDSLQGKIVFQFPLVLAAWYSLFAPPNQPCKPTNRQSPKSHPTFHRKTWRFSNPSTTGRIADSTSRHRLQRWLILRAPDQPRTARRLENRWTTPPDHKANLCPKPRTIHRERRSASEGKVERPTVTEGSPLTDLLLKSSLCRFRIELGGCRLRQQSDILHAGWLIMNRSSV
jgi:hypothetical protein